MYNTNFRKIIKYKLYFKYLILVQKESLLMNAVLWNVTPSILADSHKGFGETYTSFHLVENWAINHLPDYTVFLATAPYS
jgi:hypothetical protein